MRVDPREGDTFWQLAIATNGDSDAIVFLCGSPNVTPPPPSLFGVIQWLQILANNIFLNLKWQFPVTFYFGFSVGLTPYN